MTQQRSVLSSSLIFSESKGLTTRKLPDLKEKFRKRRELAAKSHQIPTADDRSTESVSEVKPSPAEKTTESFKENTSAGLYGIVASRIEIHIPQDMFFF